MRSRRLRFLLILSLMAIAIAARALPGPRTIDDAFITFRYSANLLDGFGFVYNPGVQTLGTTTPLWALLMAAIAGLTGGRDFPWYALTLSALIDALNTACIFLIVHRLTGRDRVAVIPALAWAISPMSVTFAVGGMETSLAILWGLAGFTLYLYRDPARPGFDLALGACIGLGLLTRVDTVLWIGPLVLAHWIAILRERADQPLWRRISWRTWLTAALIVLPFMIAAWAYFGSPIPNSVTAKRNAYIVEPNAALIRLIQTYATPFFEFDTFGPVGAMIAAFVYPALFVIAVVSVARRDARALALFAYPILYFIVFSLLVGLIFRWYMAPPLPAWMIALTVGLWALLRPLAESPRPALRPLGTVILAAVGGLWLFMSLNAWTLTPDHGALAGRPAPIMAWHRIELLYADMARYLRDELGISPTTRVAAGDIGAIGFYSGAVIVDTVGLVTPENTRYYPVDPALIIPGGNYAIPPQLIHDARPDYLVTMEGFVRLGLARDPWFIANYRLILEYPTDFYGTGMQLWARQPS
jgi:4-amino-4-deoxy-L-arabinose transferase-like glycosyltransferase